jgi:adenine deaminase
MASQASSRDRPREQVEGSPLGEVCAAVDAVDSDQPAIANYMPVGALHATWRRLIVDEGVRPSDALRVVTANVADATGLRRKGAIAPGMDADLAAFDDDWRIHRVIARGRVMVDAGQRVVRGMFDRIILDQLG